MRLSPSLCLLTLSLLTGCTAQTAPTLPQWYSAAQMGHASFVHQFAERLDRPLVGETPPLAYALHQGDRLAFSTLLKAGANPDIRDAKGITLLCEAAASADPFFLWELLASGADRDLGNGDPRRPSAPFCAAEAGQAYNLNRLRSLASQGPKTNADGLTPEQLLTR